MTAESMIACLSCGQQTNAASRACTRCGQPFPWSFQYDKLEEQLKAREVNRIRATATLVQEAFEAAKGGKPVSLAAIKGFVTSWLFPRTVIVLGSLIGGVLLLAQTYILWNQTRLLELQTRAAQLEQVLKLKDRLAAISAQTATLTRLREAYGRKLIVPTCSNDKCRSTLVRDTLQGLREDDPIAPAAESKDVWLSLGRQLSEMSSAAEKIVRQPTVSIREGDLPNNLAVVTDLLRPASSACLLEGTRLATLIERANAFALLAANSHWLVSPSENLERYISFYKQFEQVKRNTDMGLIQFEDAAGNVADLMAHTRREQYDRSAFRTSYSLPKFAEDVLALHEATLSSLDELLAACNALAVQDRMAFAAINVSFGQ